MQGVLCGNVHIKYNANCFLFQKAKYAQPYTLAQPAQHSCSFLSQTSFVLAPLGLKEMEMSAMQANSIGKKIFTSQSIKPLHQAVSSPMSPHYGGLIWKPVWPCFLFNNVRVAIKKKILLSSRLQRKSVLQLVPCMVQLQLACTVYQPKSHFNKPPKFFANWDLTITHLIIITDAFDKHLRIKINDKNFE